MAENRLKLMGEFQQTLYSTFQNQTFSITSQHGGTRVKAMRASASLFLDWSKFGCVHDQSDQSVLAGASDPYRALIGTGNGLRAVPSPTPSQR